MDDQQQVMFDQQNMDQQNVMVQENILDQQTFEVVDYNFDTEGHNTMNDI